MYITADWVQGVSWTDWQHRWVGKVDAAERAVIEQGILPSEDGLRAFAVSLRVQHLSRKSEKLFVQWWKENVGVPKRLVRLPLAASSVGSATLRRLLSGSRWTVISSARALSTAHRALTPGKVR